MRKTDSYCESSRVGLSLVMCLSLSRAEILGAELLVTGGPVFTFVRNCSLPK